MTQTITNLGSKEAEFLTTFAAQGKMIFTVAQAREFWGNPVHTIQVLARLEKGGTQ